MLVLGLGEQGKCTLQQAFYSVPENRWWEALLRAAFLTVWWYSL